MGVTEIFVGMSLAGSFCVATLRMKLGYVLWLISNIYLCIHNYIVGEHSQSFLFGAYLITTVMGLKSTYKDKYWFKPRA